MIKVGPWLLFHVLLVVRLNGNTNIKYWGIVIPIELQLLIGLFLAIISSDKLFR